MFLRRLVAAGFVLAIAVAAGCGGSGAAAKPAVSPCGTANLPAWSPDGTQIAWYGKRWPLPPLHHRPASIRVLRAFCVSDADGEHVQPVRNTVCSEHCAGPLSDPPGQLEWVGPSLLLFASDGGVSTLSLGQKPKLLARKGPDPVAVDVHGDRVATGTTFCSSCRGPVRIFSVPSGAVVGVVGGTKLNNTQPSLSPDGTQVVFARSPARDSGPGPAIWTASADGSHLQRLERRGGLPLWSPAGNLISYLAPTASGRFTLRLVAPQGGASRLLLRSGPGTIFGWSPDGRRIAYPDSKGRLAVIDVATRKVRKLLQLRLPYSSSSVAWSPDSQQLLVVWKPPAHSGCPTGLWRVPVSGAKPHLVHGC